MGSIIYGWLWPSVAFCKFLNANATKSVQFGKQMRAVENTNLSVKAKKRYIFQELLSDSERKAMLFKVAYLDIGYWHEYIDHYR
jgi:hypothetical protein